MTAQPRETPYVYIPNPRPVQPWHCASCGYDPVHIWDGHTIIGGDWNERIDTPGQLCWLCARQSFEHLCRQYGIRWAVDA